jgi:hypothetical protein
LLPVGVEVRLKDFSMLLYSPPREPELKKKLMMAVTQWRGTAASEATKEEERRNVPRTENEAPWRDLARGYVNPSSAQSPFVLCKHSQNSVRGVRMAG